MNNLIQNVLSKRKRIFYIIVFLFLLTTGLYAIGQLSLRNQENSLPENQNNQDGQGSSSPSAETKMSIRIPQAPSVPYLMSPVTSGPTIKEYSFAGNQLLYATENGIFEAGSKKALITKSISYITFNTSGDAIFQSSNSWFVFRKQNNQIIAASLTGQQAKLNKTGELIASFSNSELYMYSVSARTTKTVDTGLSIKNIFWAYDTNTIAVHGTTTNTEEIRMYNEKGELQSDIALQEGSEFLGIAPGGGSLAYTNKGELTLQSVNQSGSRRILVFDSKDTIHGNWITDRDFIVLQTPEPNSLGVFDNHIWKIGSNGTLTYLSNTFALPYKVDTTIPIRTNSVQNIISFVENKGPIWILSLVPKQYPFYAESDVFLQTLPENILDQTH